jgi:UMF1 family MFS transporter
MTTGQVSGDAQAADEAVRAEQRAWYFYDWANSAYVTTVATVLFAPYLISVAETAACGSPGTDAEPCRRNLEVLGLAVSPGSLVFYVVTLATVFSALVLPVVGAVADRSPRKKHLMTGFAWVGSACTASMFFVTGPHWELGAAALFAATTCLGASLVVYDAILCEIATPDERDRVSSRGWALGYLGGSLLLTLNLGLVMFHDTFGVEKGLAVRICLVSAALWWAGFTLIPFRGLRNRVPAVASDERAGLVRASFGQLWQTLRDLRHYPMTLTFLVAYLFFNDGIQTVIVSASTYGEKELGFATEVMVATILLVQFVAFVGALAFGVVARYAGSKHTVLGGLAVWMVVVVSAYFLPRESLVPFLALAVLIGLVLGGTQALSRSFFSQLVPRGREAEYFSLYQACERGTSWFGTLVFAVVHQVSDSYRPAILALVVFFALGLLLLARVDARRGVLEAGNDVPAVL